LANYLAFYVYTDDEVSRMMRFGSVFEGIFGPIYVAAMIHALSKIKGGERPRYLESMAVGFRNWGRLFVVRLLAGFLIVLGCIALIVPGIVLSVRYALLDPVVVMEGAGSDEARRRSTELTKGFRWQIFWVWILYFVGFILIWFLMYLPFNYFPELDTMATGVVMDCVLDVVFAIPQITMFLYYWQAVHQKPSIPYAEGRIDYELYP
jgi:uncharacterized membrane protein